MSKSVDERVVQMKFDNRQFEQGVKQTMSTLDKFKQKLNLTGASKGLDDVQKSAQEMNRVSFSNIEKGLDTLTKRFSTFGIAGMTAVSNITDSLMGLAKKAYNFTIGGVTNGGLTRAMRLQDARFQLQGVIKDATAVEEVMKDVNYGVTDTAYSLDAAAGVAAQLAASGMRAGEGMRHALKGISGVAAMTNSSYEEIGQIYTKIAGNGRLMSEELLQLSSRGMNAAATLGEQMGYTEQEIREMVSKGKISFEQFSTAMDEAFGAHAKEANRTFNGALSNIKAALAKIGAEFYEPLIAIDGPIVNLLNAIREKINEVKADIVPFLKQASTYIGDIINNISDKIKKGNKFKYNPFAEENPETKAITYVKTMEKIKEIADKTGMSIEEVEQNAEKLNARFLLFTSIKNIGQSLVEIFKSIGKAFKETFGEQNSDILFNINAGLNKFSVLIKDKIIANSEKLTKTFKGLFSILDIGWTILKKIVGFAKNILSNFVDIPDGILGITSAIGDGLIKLKDFVKNSQLLDKILNTVSRTISGFIQKIKEFFTETIKFDNIINIFRTIFNTIQGIIKELARMLGNALRSGDMKASVEVFNSGVFGGILIGLMKFVNNLSGTVKSAKGFLNSIKGVLSGVKGILKEYQKEIKAKTLKQIAEALGILALSLLVIASIDPERLFQALTGLAACIGELMGAMWLFQKVTDKMGKSDFVGAIVMASMATSLIKVAIALKILSTMSWDDIGRSLTVMGGALGLLLGSLYLIKQINKIDTEGTIKSVLAIAILANSLIIVSLALKILATMSWDDIGRSLTVMVTALGTLSGVLVLMNLINKYSGNSSLSSAFSILIVANSLVLLAGVLKILATMSWDDIQRSLAVMGGALLELTIALAVISKTTLTRDSATLLVSTLALIPLAIVLKTLSTMSWDDIGRSLVAMGVALAELVIALAMIEQFSGIEGAGALIIAATALIELAIALKIIGSMSIEQVITALLGLAGGLTIIGVAASALSGVITEILALAGAIALIGLGTALFGAGLVLIATGIGALATALSGGVTVIVAGLTAIILGVAQLVPELIKIFGEALMALLEVIITCAPMIAKTVVTVIYEVLAALAEYTPKFVAEIAKFIVGILNALAEYVPQILESLFNLIGVIFKSALDVIGKLDPDVFLKGTIAMGLLLAFMFALSSLVSVAPMAMLGLLAFGALIAELASIIALVGKLADIPGFEEMLGKGGNILQGVGTAIGQFIGGIVGGIAKGITSMLPGIATDLSEFMNNLKPFIEGIKLVDNSMIGKVAILAGTIIALSVSSFISGVTKFLTLGRDFADMGRELSDFALNILPFISTIMLLPPNAAESAAILAAAIMELTAANMLDGISSFLGQKQSLSEFGSSIGELGKGIRAFSDELGGGINQDAIRAGAEALKYIAEAANNMPREGGLWADIAGEQDLDGFVKNMPKLAKGVTEFAKNLGTDFDNERIKAGAEALKDIANAAKDIPKEDGLWQAIVGEQNLDGFADNMPKLGEGVAGFAAKVKEIDPEVVNSGANMLESIANIAKDGGFKDKGKDMEEFGACFISFCNKLTEAIQSLGQINKDALPDELNKIKQFETLANEISTIDKSKLEEFGESVKGLGSAGVDAFVNSMSGEEAKGKAGESVYQFIEKARSSVDDNKQPVYDKFKEIGQSALDGLRDNGNRESEFEQSGKNFVEGFARGINNNIYLANQAASALGRRSVESLNESVDEHSPSKITAKSGRYFTIGFINGINEYASKAGDAAASVGSYATKGLQNAVSKVYDAMSSDIDNQPTIRPVLDLSEIEAGASTLNSMLDINKNLALSANLSSISTSINRRLQNRGNDDVISAIKDLSKSISGNTGDTYNVNGINYSDDAEISDAIRTLVKASVVERRT